MVSPTEQEVLANPLISISLITIYSEVAGNIVLFINYYHICHITVT